MRVFSLQTCYFPSSELLLSGFHSFFRELYQKKRPGPEVGPKRLGEINNYESAVTSLTW